MQPVILPQTILCHALPAAFVSALAEQGFASPRYTLLQDNHPDVEQWGLVLTGATQNLPATLDRWRGQGLRAAVLLLGQGQDDWAVTERLALPIRLGLLVARMRYYLHRAQDQKPEFVQCGDYNLDTARKLLSRNQAEESLTEKEAAILLLLATQQRPWNREDLLREVWGYRPELDTHTLETHIYRLRRKLAALGPGDIVSTPAGYLLSC